jgi:flavodoxin
MKSVIIYDSYHHMNTQKIAMAMAHAIGAEIMPVQKAYAEAMEGADLIGLGSGVYYGKFGKKMIDFINQNEWTGKKMFLFSTSGFGADKYNDTPAQLLAEKNAELLGRFHCRGYDTYPLFKLVGGLSKGYPDEDDIQDAEKFAVEMRKIAFQL